MFYFTIGTLFWISKLQMFANTPKHILKHNMADAIIFLISMQKSDDPLIGTNHKCTIITHTTLLRNPFISPVVKSEYFWLCFECRDG